MGTKQGDIKERWLDKQEKLSSMYDKDSNSVWRAPNGVFLKKQPADTMSVNEVWEEEDHRTVAICPDVYGTYTRIWDGSEDFGSSEPVDIAKRIRDDKHVSTVNDVQCSVAGRPSFISKTGEGVYRELRDDRGRISRHDGPAII